MSDKVTARARVTATVEVELTSTWGTGCALDQVHKQATDEAIAICNVNFNHIGFRVIGTPRVEAIITKS